MVMILDLVRIKHLLIQELHLLILTQIFISKTIIITFIISAIINKFNEFCSKEGNCLPERYTG